MWHWKYDYYLTLSDISIGLMGGWFYYAILGARHFMVREEVEGVPSIRNIL